MSGVKKTDRFHTVVAILIALVTVIGAISSRRIASILDQAGGEDSAGIRAITNREDVTTRATIILTEHLDAYWAYLENRSLADSYAALAKTNVARADLNDRADAFRVSSNHAKDKIPQAYLDREGQLDQLRDLGEHIAEDAHDKDIEAQPHFGRADGYRKSAMWLFASLVLLGTCLVLLTTADAIHSWVRYVFLAAGIVSLIVALGFGLMVEVLSAFGITLPWIT
jgi:hypothetical protein